MHVFILGANGRTGQFVLKETLAQGHTVTALVRKSSSLTAQEGLTIIEGTPLDRADIERAFKESPIKPEAVISTLAATRASDSPFSKQTAPLFMMRDAFRNVSAVMKTEGVERLVVLSAFGSGATYAQAAWPLKLLVRHSGMTPQYEDHDAIDAEIKVAEGLRWTLVRPPMLKDEEAKAVRTFGEDGKGIGMFDSCTRASVAKFLVDAVANKELENKAIAIAN